MTDDLLDLVIAVDAAMLDAVKTLLDEVQAARPTIRAIEAGSPLLACQPTDPEVVSELRRRLVAGQEE